MSKILKAAAEQLSYNYDDSVSLLSLPIAQRNAIDERLDDLFTIGYKLKISQSAYSKATNIVYLTLLVRKDFTFTCPACGNIDVSGEKAHLSYKSYVYDSPIFYYNDKSEKKHNRVNLLAPKASLACKNKSCEYFDLSKSVANWWEPTLVQGRKLISSQTALTEEALSYVLDICLENSFILTAPNRHIIKQICKYIALPEEKAKKLLSRPAFEKLYLEKRKELYNEVY